MTEIKVRSNCPNAEAKKSNRLPLAALAIWLVVVVVASQWMTLHDFRTDDHAVVASIPNTWPTDSKLPRTAGQPALVVFVHPKCPCTQATIGELERLMSLIGESPRDELQVIIVATTPQASDNSWTNSSLLQRARLLPNSQLFFDAGGAEASRFGARTSGTVILFDEGGSRLYDGGVTNSRGHEGSSTGQNTLVTLLRGGETHVSSMPVFGCRLVLASDVTNLNPDDAHSESSLSQAGSLAPIGENRIVSDLTRHDAAATSTTLPNESR